MKKASDIFDEGARERIRQAVAEAEKSTSGEIVPVAATASGRYDRAEDIFGLVFALAMLTGAWLALCVKSSGDWGGFGIMTSLPLSAALLILLVCFSLGAALATWLPSLRLLFISKTEMSAEVEKASAAAFHNFRAHGTAARTGVLIYVSLYERMVRVVADDSVMEKVDPEAWSELVETITSGMAKGQPADGMAAAIKRLGELLSAPFPRLTGDVDELSNELRIVD